MDVREAMKTEVTCDTTGGNEYTVKLESIDVVGKMKTTRIYNYIESVRDDLYRCESLMGENSPQAKQIRKWVMDAYEILNNRGHKIPRR
jgi:hypothetical protein